VQPARRQPLLRAPAPCPERNGAQPAAQTQSQASPTGTACLRGKQRHGERERGRGVALAREVGGERAAPRGDRRTLGAAVQAAQAQPGRARRLLQRRQQLLRVGTVGSGHQACRWHLRLLPIAGAAPPRVPHAPARRQQLRRVEGQGQGTTIY
jgi:hypothetical protein